MDEEFREPDKLGLLRPEPVVVTNNGEAMGARFHAQVALIYAIETSLTEDGAKPEDIKIDFLETP